MLSFWRVQKSCRFICLHYGSSLTPLSIRQSSVTCGYFLRWKNWLAPAHETSKPGHTENFKPILALALLPSDPVITAHTRHQHYYSSNHSIIIPQSTSKRQLTFQGKNKNSWIMHYEGLNQPSEAAEAQFLLSGARPKLDHQDLCWCNLKKNVHDVQTGQTSGLGTFTSLYFTFTMCCLSHM